MAARSVAAVAHRGVRPRRGRRPVVLLSVAALAALALAARRRLVLVRVVGASMAPTYHPGDRLLAVRTRRVRRGDVVVFRLPDRARAVAGPAERDRPAVKRVAAAAGETARTGGPPVGPGRIHLRGDAPRSLDSDVYGTVALTSVIARALPRAGRRPAHGARRVP